MKPSCDYAGPCDFKAKPVPSIPIEKLQALVNEWRELNENFKGPSAHAWISAADQLSELIKEAK